MYSSYISYVSESKWDSGMRQSNSLLIYEMQCLCICLSECAYMSVVYKLSYVKIFKIRRFSIVWLYYFIYSLVLFIYSFMLHIAGYLWFGIEIFSWAERCKCTPSVNSGLLSLRDMREWVWVCVILLCNPNEAHIKNPLDLKHLWKSNRESQNIQFHRKEAAWQPCESHFYTFTQSAWHLLTLMPSNM